MNGLDLEAVLRDHEWQPTTEPYGWCACGESHKRVSHRAHVAAVLRVEIESALADAWDEGYGDRHYAAENLAIFKHEAEMLMRDHDANGACCLRVRLEARARTNPYRPTLAATEGES